MIHITESQVLEILTVAKCVEILRDAFSGDFVNIPRYRLHSRNSLLHVLSASIPDLDRMGVKVYGTSRAGAHFVVLLFQESTGQVLAVIEADALGQIRTGAASGLATDLLARQDAQTGSVIGSGFQAETQLLAIDAVRNLREIRVFSRSPQNRRNILHRMQGRLRARLVESQTAEDCVRDADIICTITSSKDPVLKGDWLKAGCHINAAGSNWASKRELDSTAIKRASLICVDHREQAKIESGDLIQAIENLEEWNNIRELSEVVRGNVRRTSAGQITLFKSNGIALEDIAAAHYVFENFKARSASGESDH